jgi:hypothetical protein
MKKINATLLRKTLEGRQRRLESKYEELVHKMDASTYSAQLRGIKQELGQVIKDLSELRMMLSDPLKLEEFIEQWNMLYDKEQVLRLKALDMSYFLYTYISK